LFNPLGSFDPNAPLLQDALGAAKAFRSTLPAIPQGTVERIYLHWAVEPFGCTDGAYNFEVDLEGGQWVMKMTHDPRDNMAGLNENAAASHTWERNTDAIGIAISGMDGATSTDFGPDGVQLHELEYLCALAAIVSVDYGVDTMGKVPAPGRTHPSSNDSGDHPGSVNTTGENNIETHGTVAEYDDYPGERWDLGCLHALPPGVSLTAQMRTASAEALRQRIHAYAAALKG
jgi:hypothetical protein